MKWNEFYRSLDSGDIAPVYLFTGPEEYIKREAINRLRQKLLPPGLEALNDTTLEGVTAQQITDAAETMPMMCKRRIVTVRDWAPLLSRTSKDEEREVAWMLRWLENPAPDCVLVFFIRQNADARKKLTGELNKRGATVEFDLLSDAELTKWCANRAKAAGLRMNARAVSVLTFMAGQELTRLSGEMEKLCAYAGDRGEITEADVREIVPASLEYKVYQMIGYLLAGDMLQAQRTANSLIQGGEKPIGLMSMLTSQLRQMTHMRCALDAGKPVQAVQEELKMKAFSAKMIAKQVSRLSASWLAGLYDTALEYDFAVKSGRLRDQDACNMLLYRVGLADRRR